LLGIYFGYWLRGPKVAAQQEIIAALRETVAKVEGALE
jgi:hypothetical protein